jgi:fructan beta-fructosidase
MKSFSQSVQKNENDYRPYIHFTPKSGWMNDPNGLVFYKGNYHLFFQHYPYGTQWGPMHWGHAISNDLLHWKELPIALYPDSLGYIFSGSAVCDIANTSELGTKNNPPLIAIFTQHNETENKKGSITFQNQSIAFSLDEGQTWHKYKKNPVIKNPGITDFRDPKVIWYESEKKWIMVLAVKDHVSIYSSKNLLQWQWESDFGKNEGSHAGVWECPDLFTLTHNDKKVWVLTVSINPGGPNKGSATQYFVGSFNGKSFTSNQQKTKWIDYGRDNYAGVTFSGTGDRKIFVGWMSNWDYANFVPTKEWRSAFTIPRNLSLKKIANEYYLASNPIEELDKLIIKKESTAFTSTAYTLNAATILDLYVNSKSNFTIQLENELHEKIITGFTFKQNEFYVDRTKAGNTTFSDNFSSKSVTKRIAEDSLIHYKLLIDKTSVEIFADDGLNTITEIFFPHLPFTNCKVEADMKGEITIKTLKACMYN